MKYCTSCKKVYEDNVKKCVTSEWHSLVPLNTEKELKCKKCGSTKDLRYSPPWSGIYGSYGNEFECQECYDKWMAKAEREEAMNYILIDKYSDDISFFDKKKDLEEHLEEWISNFEGNASDYGEYLLILKIYKVKLNELNEDSFEYKNNKRIVIYDNEAYTIESVSQPEIEYNGDWDISW